MANTYSGQAKNVPNLLSVIDILAELGPKWNPILDSLTIDVLKARHAAADALLDNYSTAFSYDQLKTDERAKVYKPLNDVVRRLYAAAQACKMTPTTIEKVKTFKDVIDGTNIGQAAAKREKEEEKAKAKLIEGESVPETPKKRSVSEQSYDERFNNFKQLVNFLTTSGEYKTNEPDLTLKALNIFLDNLAAANKLTNDADKALANIKAVRDNILSGDQNSILADVRDIKLHLITMEGKKGTTYKKVIDFDFIK